jgi:hypothetical protein
MNKIQDKINTELPSRRQLVKSTILAILIAAVLLITVILPAEYGVDPLSTGNLLGLTKMGEIKVSLKKEVAEQQNSQQITTDASDIGTENLGETEPEFTDQAAPVVREDEIVFLLDPDQGKEIKLKMKTGHRVDFKWWTDGGTANYDSHADSKVLNIDYHSYSKGSKALDENILVAEFDGNHGWFWRNRTSEPMTISLQVKGEYSEIF